MAKKNRAPNTYLTLRDARQILLRCKRGVMTNREIANEFGITEMTVWRVKTGKGRFSGLEPASRKMAPLGKQELA